jgi:hypothetical protein
MSSEEIRKLLGGYATNTLSESERNALFKAALDDQELFNALQQEEALKDLLADPVTRAEIRHALELPASGRLRAAWRMRWWAWGGAVSAVAAIAIVFAVIQRNQVPASKPEIQIASAEKAERPGPPPMPQQAETRAATAPQPAKPAPAAAGQSIASLKKQAAAKPAGTNADAVELKGELARNAAAAAPNAPAPVIPPPVRAEPAEQTAQLRQSPQAGSGQAAIGGAPTVLSQPLALSGRAQLASAVAGVANYQGPLLRYSLLKQDVNGAEVALASGAELKAGDTVRLRVSPGLSGYLALYERDAAGQWKPISGAIVQAGASYDVPATPIRVSSNEQRFRLALDPSAPPRAQADARAKTMRAEQAPRTPLVVEINLTGK